MKNIHILPTDKPSRLRIHECGQLFLSVNFIYEINDENKKHIYITSDEEIKDGDWFLTDDKRVEKRAPDWRAREWHKKIILTTDQDLIKDGVQAIDDEFLEWFVKNPSCEEVEIEAKWFTYMEYKIIIPKEEPTIVRLPTYYEPKQDLEKEMFELEQQLDIPSNLRWHNSKLKQETLEDFCIEFVKKHFEDEKTYNPSSIITAMKVSAKWQQERSYSEEEVEVIVKDAYTMGRNNILIGVFNKWFEQFKNK